MDFNDRRLTEAAGTGPKSSASLFRIGRFALALLGVSYICSASPFVGFRYLAALGGCGYDDIRPTLPFYPRFHDEARETSSGPCFPSLPSENDLSIVIANGSMSRGKVSSSAIVIAQGDHASTSARVTADDVLYIKPPLGSGILNAGLRVEMSYILSLDGGGGATAELIVGTFPYILADHIAFVNTLSPGTEDGTLDSGLLLIQSCPCSVAIEEEIYVSAKNGTASAVDPLTIELPPGWTYTLASDAGLTSVPEPGTLVPIGCALIAAGMCFRRLRRNLART
jgi:hypothetical protein